MVENVNVKEWKTFGKPKKLQKTAKKFKKGVDIISALCYYIKVVSARDTQTSDTNLENDT